MLYWLDFEQAVLIDGTALCIFVLFCNYRGYPRGPAFSYAERRELGRFAHVRDFSALFHSRNLADILATVEDTYMFVTSNTWTADLFRSRTRLLPDRLRCRCTLVPSLLTVVLFSFLVSAVCFCFVFVFV